MAHGADTAKSSSKEQESHIGELEDVKVVAELCRVLRGRVVWITCLTFDGSDMMMWEHGKSVQNGLWG
jgi:hypothetical protein